VEFRERFPGDRGRGADLPLGEVGYTEEAVGVRQPMREVDPPARPRMPQLEQYDDRDLMRRSTQGSRPMTRGEIKRGYRKL
jgi:hypothetical protein